MQQQVPSQMQHPPFSDREAKRKHTSHSHEDKTEHHTDFEEDEQRSAKKRDRRDVDRDWERERERERYRDRERDRDRDRDRGDRGRERERDSDKDIGDRSRNRDRDRDKKKHRDRDMDKDNDDGDWDDREEENDEEVVNKKKRTYVEPIVALEFNQRFLEGKLDWDSLVVEYPSTPTDPGQAERLSEVCHFLAMLTVRGIVMHIVRKSKNPTFEKRALMQKNVLPKIITKTVRW